MDISVPVRKKKTLGGFAKKKRSERIFLAIIFAFPILQFIVMYVGVNINSVLLAFQTYEHGVGYYYNPDFLINFKEVMHIFSMDSQWFTRISNGMIYYFFSTFIGIPINLFVAYLLYKKIAGAEFFRTVLFIPSLISSMAMVIMYQTFFDWGVDEFLKTVCKVNEYDVPSFFYDATYAFPLMIFYGLWTGVSGGMIIYMSAMSRVPVSVIEYGRIEGISLLREFVSVILPMIYPTIALFLVTGIPGLFMSSGPLYAFYGDSLAMQVPKMETLSYYLYRTVTVGSFQDYPRASAMGLVVTLVTAPLVFGARYLLDRFDPNVEY